VKARTIKASADMEKLHRDLATVLKAYPTMKPLEYMCVVAKLLGQLIAYQDQTTHSTAAIMAMVELNIQMGNKQAIEALMAAEAGTMQ